MSQADELRNNITKELEPVVVTPYTVEELFDLFNKVEWKNFKTK